MYSADLPEQLICEKTGHRSEAVREYKRTSTIQQQEASDVVQGTKRKCETVTCDHSEVVHSQGKSIKIQKTAQNHPQLIIKQILNLRINSEKNEVEKIDPYSLLNKYQYK